MNRGVYSAAMGMSAAQRWMDVAANNLANVSTDGYKADGIAFGDALVREMHSGNRDLGSLGSGPRASKEYTDLRTGPIRPTNNALDVALPDPGTMIAVRDGGTTKYTRGGAFTLDATGTLVTSGGAKVLDTTGAPIRLDRNAKIQVDPQGRIQEGGRVVAQLGVVEGQFRKEGHNLWTGANVKASRAEIAPNSLEGSNVDALAGMVDLIKIGRHVEMAQRAVNTHDESTSKLLGILGR